MVYCVCVCLKAYHVHIRSISHNQNMAEAKKKKMLAKRQLESSSAPVSAGPQSTAAGRPAASSAGSTSTDPGPRSILKSAQLQSATDTESSAEKPAKGPNYCDVCCFEFSSSEVDICHLVSAVRLSLS